MRSGSGALKGLRDYKLTIEGILMTIQGLYKDY